MPQVNFTSALKRFFPSLENQEVKGNNVSEIFKTLEHTYPGMMDFLVDEQGQLRQHINVFIAGELMPDRQNLTEKLSSETEVLIFQALSGG